MRENRDFVVPVNILTTFAHAPFSWAARHTTVCLDGLLQVYCMNKISNNINTYRTVSTLPEIQISMNALLECLLMDFL